MSVAKTVLLVDDDPELVGAFKTVLEHRGYRVLAAADGNSGLAAAERDRPDLIVVDLMMPKRSGLVVLETLKGRGQACPPVIMITASESGRQRDYAQSLGADDFLRKPFPVEQLVRSVERLCPLAESAPCHRS